MRIVLVQMVSLFTAVSLVAQQPPAPQTAKPAVVATAKLTLTVLLGKNAVNDILGRVVTAPVIEVRDERDQPVEGASVIFELPADGPGGFFPGNKITLTKRTNGQGQASAAFAPNGVAGSYNMRATATSGDRFGDVIIPQSNALITPGTQDRPPARWYSRKKWLIIGGLGAAATIGAVLATRGSSSSTTTQSGPPVITITLGPPVFGGR